MNTPATRRSWVAGNKSLSSGRAFGASRGRR
jgi:hypothetical protein